MLLIIFPLEVLIFPFLPSFLVTPSHALSLPVVSLRNALIVLIFAHLNTRVSQQRLNSSAGPCKADHTVYHWHLDRQQPTWLLNVPADPTLERLS